MHCLLRRQQQQLVLHRLLVLRCRRLHLGSGTRCRSRATAAASAQRPGTCGCLRLTRTCSHV
jgi:hypothetical protein